MRPSGPEHSTDPLAMTVQVMPLAFKVWPARSSFASWMMNTPCVVQGPPGSVPPIMMNGASVFGSLQVGALATGSVDWQPEIASPMPQRRAPVRK